MAKSTSVTAEEMAELANRAQELSAELRYVSDRMRKYFVVVAGQRELTQHAKDFSGLAAASSDLTNTILIAVTMANERE